MGVEWTAVLRNSSIAGKVKMRRRRQSITEIDGFRLV